MSWTLFHVRATVLPLTLLTLVMLFYFTRQVRYPLAALAFFFLAVSTNYAMKAVWHTAYVGVGAYPNTYMPDLSDNNGYALFEKQAGVQLRLSSPTDNYYEPKIYDAYTNTLKAEFLAIASERPDLVIRNAALNFLQAYSFGYPVGHLTLAYISAFLGGVVVLLLFWARQYWLMLGIGAVAVAFAPYFPPIPAYMFGGYMLLAVAAAEGSPRVARHLWPTRRPRNERRSSHEP
jgi:hypothetical protein